LFRFARYYRAFTKGPQSRNSNKYSVQRDSNLEVTFPKQISSNGPVRQSFFALDGREKPMLEVILKRFEKPDEVRTFEKGKFELVHLGGMTIGRATYEPGWKWSLHVGGPPAQKAALWSTSEWFSRDARRPQWTMGESSK
jgi:hypothetical protein